MLNAIIGTYIADDSPKYINLTQNIKDNIRKNSCITEECDSASILNEAEERVSNTLKSLFTGFLESNYISMIDKAYSFIEYYMDLHPALKYAIRKRVYSTSVTDPTTHFQYCMGQGRIGNPNSCFKAENKIYIQNTSISSNNRPKSYSESRTNIYIPATSGVTNEYVRNVQGFATLQSDYPRLSSGRSSSYNSDNLN